MLRSIGKQSGESVESVLEKKKEGYGGKDLQKRKVLTACHDCGLKVRWTIYIRQFDWSKVPLLGGHSGAREDLLCPFGVYGLGKGYVSRYVFWFILSGSKDTSEFVYIHLKNAVCQKSGGQLDHFIPSDGNTPVAVSVAVVSAARSCD